MSGPEVRDTPGRRDLHHQKAEQDLEIWQIAVEHLIRAAETGGWLAYAGAHRRTQGAPPQRGV
jgi:hypothetical protein